MIRPERLTIKAQEAFRDAAAIAAERGNPVINDAHLFAALLAQDEGVVQPLLQKAGLNIAALREATDREIAKFPTQEGGAPSQSYSHDLTSKDLREALAAVRGSHRVTDQAPEEKYQALERYTRNLTAQARTGKL